MKLEQSFEVAAPLDQVWAALIDVERVAPCLPGAEVTGRNDDGSYDGSFRVKIGPTAAAYVGKLEMSEVDEAARTATMQASGTDRRGQGGAKATIVSSVKEGSAGATVVEVVTDYSITGRLARFGRAGMIEEIGNQLLTEFAASLQGMLAGPGDYETFVGMPAVGAAEGATTAQPAEGAGSAQGDKPKRRPRKDLAAAAEAVAAASQPGASSSVPGQAEPAAAEPEPAAAQSKAEPEPVAAAGESELEAEQVPDLAAEAAAEEGAALEASADEGLAVEAAAEDELAAVVPEASTESEPPASSPPPPPSTEPEALDGIALARSVIVQRIKSNPAPLVALLLAFVLLRRRRRRRG
jgi:uncharacterized protein